MIQGLDHYNLRAPRPLLEEIKDFYCNVVGLAVGERPLRSYGYWLYGGGAAILHLSEASKEEMRDPEAVNTFDHAAFKCTGYRGMEQKLVSLGLEFRTAVVPSSGRIQMFLKDPAGNGVELNFENADA